VTVATVRSTIELTVRGRVLLLLATLATTAAWLTGDVDARLAAGLLAAPLFVDFVAKPRRLERVRVHVVRRRTVAGAPFVDQVELRNEGDRRLLELRLLEPRTSAPGGGALLDRLAKGGVAMLPLPARGQQRGRRCERTFVLHSSWPFGFLRSRAVLTIAAELIVEPARVPLSPQLLRAADDQQTGQRDARTLPGPEFHSLREYRLGDDARRVHALRSSTLGSLVTVTWHGNVPRSVGLVLDLRRPPGRSPRRGGARFEWSLSAAATLLEMLRAQDATVHAVLLGNAADQLTIAASAEEQQFLALLAAAAPTAHQSLPAATWAGLRRCEQVYWLAAGGHRATDALALGTRVTLVGGELP